MKILSTQPADLTHFGDLSGRVSAAVDAQATLWNEGQPWALLPSLEDATTWRVIASTENQRRVGLEVVSAYTGMFFNEFAIEVIDNENLFVARGNTTSGLAAFVDAVELMVEVRRAAPDDLVERRYSMQELIRDFYIAIGDEQGRDAIQFALDRIKKTGETGIHNLQFLEVAAYAACGDWTELESQEWFEDLCRRPHPLRTSHRLLEAIGRATFDGLGEDASLTEMREAFRIREVSLRFPELLAKVEKTSSTAGANLLKVHALESGDTERQIRLHQNSLGSDRGLSEPDPELEAPKAEAPLENTEQKLQRLLYQENAFQAVIETVFEIEGKLQANVARIACSAAFELEDRKIAADLFAKLDESILVEALAESKEFRRSFDYVAESARNNTTGWSEWLQRVCDETWPDAFSVLEDSAESWPIEEFKNLETAQRLADLLLEAVGGSNAAEVRKSLGFFCGLTRRLLISESQGSEPLVQVLLLVFASEESPGEATRRAFIDLIESLLWRGVEREGYNLLLETSLQMWTEIESARTTGWLIDLTDVFIGHQCPQVEGLRQLLLVGRASLVRFRRRINVGLVEIFNELCAEFGEMELGIEIPSEPEILQNESETQTHWSKLSGSQIGVHTLLENCQERLERRLLMMGADVKVFVDSSHVGNEKLDALVRRVDHMIVDTRHAKHAATQFIAKIPPPEKQVFPEGGGISSFIRALEKRLA